MPTRAATLAAVVAVLLATTSVSPSAGAGDYATDVAGVVNIQASTDSIHKTCPGSAPWLRDPNVCAQRWSAFANDKSESDLAVDPTDSNHIVGMSKAFFSPKDYLFELVWYDSTDGGQTWQSGILPGYEQWMDTTDPVVAFDSQGNLYALVLLRDRAIGRPQLGRRTCQSRRVERRHLPVPIAQIRWTGRPPLAGSRPLGDVSRQWARHHRRQTMGRGRHLRIAPRFCVRVLDRLRRRRS